MTLVDYLWVMVVLFCVIDWIESRELDDTPAARARRRRK